MNHANGSTRPPRTLIAQCVIGSACLLGIALGVLEPLRGAQRDALAQLEEAQAMSARAGELAGKMPVLAAEMAQMTREAELVARHSAAAHETARLNASIEQAARRSGVDVLRTQPREMPHPVAQPGVAASSEAGGPVTVSPDAVTGFSLDVAGTYDGLASFVSAIERELGFTRIESLRLVPEGSASERVRATISTAHFAFTVPKAAPSVVAAPALSEVKP